MHIGARDRTAAGGGEILVNGPRPRRLAVAFERSRRLQLTGLDGTWHVETRGD
jgi:hypothetical protein